MGSTAVASLSVLPTTTVQLHPDGLLVRRLFLLLYLSIWLPSPWGVLNRFGKWISTEHSTDRSVLEEQHLWILFPGLESDEGRGKCDFPSRNSQTTNGVRKTNVLL